LKQQMNGSAGIWLSEPLRIHRMQVIWAVQNEMARTVEDVLSRRTRALLLDAAESIRIAPEVAVIMAKELGKDQDWINEQVSAYSTLAQQYILN
jgi:glycerol-3-phosphate dehydrogenase